MRRRFGRYELIGELARGGMGTVYLARHAGEAGFQRLFAIKVMHPHLAEEKAFVDMLHDEARISARIHHPNVVAILDLGSQDDVHYVVLDYIEGMPFSNMLKRSSPAAFAEIAVTVLIDTLEGLYAAHMMTDDDGHNLQLVHRDVSPQNILVGTDGLARITDFGIAKAETRITSTQPGMRKGKLAFMAPEQIMNDDAIDMRADIWAAGVVLWTALTGKHLFRAANDAGTIHGVLTKPVEAPSAVVQGVPPYFDDIVLRALDREPANRFASAFEMAEALRAAAHSNGMSCSKHKVAQWVTDTFGDELRARRQAIRAAAARKLEEHEQTEASRITVLSVLPSVGPHSKVGSGSLSRSAVGSYTPPGLSPSSMPPDAASGSIVPYASQPEILSPADIALIDESRPSRKGLWVTAGILSVALIGSVLYLMRADGDEEPSQSVATQPMAAHPVPAPPDEKSKTAAETPADPKAAAQAAAENVQATTPEQLAAEKPEPEANAEEDAEGDDKTASKRTARPRVTRSYARRPAARPEREAAAEPANEPTEAKPEAPTTVQRPLPKPATGGVVIENNPYMRK
ncbi:MAG TPA: serine/threonine-protein kinase [Polyangiaceae bacterium]